MNTPTDRLSAALTGRYRIERELGAGGMATVYLAEDLKHDRKVAIKVLKPELAAVLGAERFVVEIKTTAAMSHPHILPLFDSGTADSFLFYVMPFIEGETIRERLNRETQLGVEEAVRIAREVADALDYAHRHGVIHRDIKPENILLHDGRAMVMDFGIALAVSAAAGGRMTETGLSLGTPHYMSPEQATAEKEITGRSDQYSLASVLYEMLAGVPPHEGGSAQQTIMRIITEPARPVNEFRKNVPGNVIAALAKSLEKLPADRFESAKAFADALGSPSYVDARGGHTASARGAPDARSPLHLALATAAVVAAAGWIWSAVGSSAPLVKRTRFVVAAPDSIRPRADSPGQNFAISPDGSELTYPAGGNLQLYRHRLDELESTPIAGTFGAGQAKYSPDGQWLTFVQGGTLKKMPRAGGPAVSVMDSVSHYSWGDGDLIVFNRNGALWSVAAAGGSAALIAAPDSTANQTYSWPFLLPGGKAFLFDIVTAGDQAGGQLAAMRLDDRKVIPLGISGRNPRFLPSGHLAFGRLDGTVTVAAFDPDALRVTGPAVTVLENVSIKAGGASEFGVGRDGTLFYVQGSSEGEVLLVERSGGVKVLLPERRGYSNLRFSPTSGRIAFQMTDRASYAKTDIWLYDDLTRTVTRLTNDGVSGTPAWMPDGERVVWIAQDSGGRRVRRQRWDGGGVRETLFPELRDMVAVTPSPSGKAMAVIRAGTFGDIYVVTDETSALRPLVVTPTGEGGARISPDGKWVAYWGDESGQREVYVVAISGDGGRRQISTEGGTEPVWAPDGRTLYYRSGGNWIAADIVTAPSFAVTRRTSLFADRYRRTNGTAGYDIARDGRTFVVVGDGAAGSQRLVVATGWLDELRERVAPTTRLQP